MDISEQGLKEFRKLKGPRISELEAGPIHSDSTGDETEYKQVFLTKKFDKKRKDQIQVGHFIDDFFEKDLSIHVDPVAPSFKSHGPGRPKKASEEKVRFVGMKLSPKYIAILKKFTFGKGVGSKVRFLIDKYEDYTLREQKQVAVVKTQIGSLDFEIKKYSSRFKKAEKFETNQLLLDDIYKKSSEIRLLISLLHIEISQYSDFLSNCEMKTLEFAMGFAPNESVL
ncbi:MAG: hypothetical protein HOE90_05135 [Bacteriovoracaceae bacterium]|jgi:hypothetical protein|nr:hypothetical protein [Bacteriovoracaceae bacterium]